MTIVIDTNIIVSALLSPEGNAFQLLSDVMEGKHVVLITKEIYVEYEDVLHREKFGFDEDIVSYILQWFRKNAIWIEINTSKEFMPDEDDRIFYDVAKSCKARLITGNVRHYPTDELVTELWEII